MSISPEKNYEMGLLLDHYGALLTERQRDLCDLYYNDDLSLSEISEECGISRQGVRDALVKAEAQLTGYEAALGLLKREREDEKRLARANELISALAPGKEKSELETLIKELLALRT